MTIRADAAKCLVILPAPALGLVLLNSPLIGAAIPPEEIARLDNELTPVGAERAGNSAGTIPAWTGGLSQQPVDPVIGYVDPYADDPVLFTITADNVAEYADRLSIGHRELFRKFPDTYRMNVYPTRRSANWPEHVLEQVKLQAPLARTEGYNLLDVGKSAVPFPIPGDALQMMWNHSLRWRGGSVAREYSWFPVDRSGRYFTVRVAEALAFDQQGYMKESRPNRLANFYGMYLAPATIEGQLTLIWEPINEVEQSRQTWSYQTVSRRVVRDPALPTTIWTSGHKVCVPATSTMAGTARPIFTTGSCWASANCLSATTAISSAPNN